jgi:hypothetical protein
VEEAIPVFGRTLLEGVDVRAVGEEDVGLAIGACRCGVSLLSSENAMGRGEKWIGEAGCSWESSPQ